jgi:hypothetical protein
MHPFLENSLFSLGFLWWTRGENAGAPRLARRCNGHAAQYRGDNGEQRWRGTLTFLEHDKRQGSTSLTPLLQKHPCSCDEPRIAVRPEHVFEYNFGALNRIRSTRISLGQCGHRGTKCYSTIMHCKMLKCTAKGYYRPCSSASGLLHRVSML